MAITKEYVVAGELLALFDDPAVDQVKHERLVVMLSLLICVFLTCFNI